MYLNNQYLSMASLSPSFIIEQAWLLLFSCLMRAEFWKCFVPVANAFNSPRFFFECNGSPVSRHGMQHMTFFSRSYRNQGKSINHFPLNLKAFWFLVFLYSMLSALSARARAMHTSSPFWMQSTVDLCPLTDNKTLNLIGLKV